MSRANDCYLVLRGCEYAAIPEGKSAQILRPVPGNTYRAGIATWRSVPEAVAELLTWGYRVTNRDHGHWCERCHRQWQCPNGAVCEMEATDGSTHEGHRHRAARVAIVRGRSPSARTAQSAKGRHTMSLCPSCNAPLVGTQVTCSRDCAEAEAQRASDAEIARCGVVQAAPATPLPVRECCYCGEETCDGSTICDDCDDQYDRICDLLRDCVYRADAPPIKPHADKIMRLFFPTTAVRR